MSGIEIVDGRKIRVHFDAKKCIHSRGCVLSHPEVFVPNVQGEWIHPDAATPEAVAEIAHNCPSGAIEVVTGTGKTVNRTAGAAFCRCGHSGNKPYCDGSHASVGFRAPGA